MGLTVFTPVSQDTFVNGDERVTLAGSRLRRGDGTILEKVERAAPSTADLHSYTGDYSSDEAQSTLRVFVDGERLVIQNRPGTSIPLAPTYRDAFTSTLGIVRFLRDASGAVTEISVSQDRVWDLRFKRR
jgi:hypothetical protein